MDSADTGYRDGTACHQSWPLCGISIGAPLASTAGGGLASASITTWRTNETHH